uniref:Uncharacterized protein n=1 Tax=Candidatus Kentrum sp. MB TaxID=2138164 RepID=A0A450X6Y9_9GAMM|nr:MAG: hypothetical protein BECKMB1821G_GA0114241_101067 [Candidatus Kentron sp. MB]
MLGKLLREGHSVAIPWGLAWAERWHRERGANYVLEPLWDRGVSPETLRPWCIAWIRNCPAKVNPTFLLEKLIHALPKDAGLNAIARQWLAAAPPEHGSWSFVWQALMEVYPDDADLYRQGRRFLEEAPDTHGSWPHTWRTCRQPCRMR